MVLASTPISHPLSATPSTSSGFIDMAPFQGRLRPRYIASQPTPSPHPCLHTLRRGWLWGVDGVVVCVPDCDPYRINNSLSEASTLGSGLEMHSSSVSTLKLCGCNLCRFEIRKCCFRSRWFVLLVSNLIGSLVELAFGCMKMYRLIF